MRKKKNLEARIERCGSVIISEPEALKGAWGASFFMPDGSAYREIRLEIGCGKGAFICATAAENPDIFFVADERVPEALVMAAEQVVAGGLLNVRFVTRDASVLADIFAPDEISAIYLNFSDPWPRSRNAKRRLTHKNFLEIYDSFLRPGGRIYFKTDNDALFDFSIEEMESFGLKLENVTRDLHSTGIKSAVTEYERRFMEEGKNINYLEAVKTQAAS